MMQASWLLITLLVAVRTGTVNPLLSAQVKRSAAAAPRFENDEGESSHSREYEDMVEENPSNSNPAVHNYNSDSLEEAVEIHMPPLSGSSVGGERTSGGGGGGGGRSRIVDTKYGRVQGLSLTIAQGRNNPLKNKIVEVFAGIPYASPPIKSHRFGPTQNAVPWEGVREAVKPGAVCPQMMPDIRNESAALREMPRGYFEYLKKVEPYLNNQSEDCLYLNVYTPIGPDPKLRPVVVFIHGGKFSWGSGNLYDGTVLCAYADVVFVSLNFRLNVLGFFNAYGGPNAKPFVANYGLMDQIAALHWIKENILKFGGDPENVSLLGYESGAACVNFLMSSPAVTPGLFHRAVLIGGSAHATWSIVPDPSRVSAALAKYLNCSNEGSPSIATASPPSSSQQLFGRGYPTKEDPSFHCIKSKHFSEFGGFGDPKFGINFGPSVDGVVIRPGFRGPAVGGSLGTLDAGQQMLPPPLGKRNVPNKKYDVLFGLSSLERLTEFGEADLTSGFEYSRRDSILRTLIRNSYRFHLNEILATIANEYTDWEKSSQHPIPTRDLTISALTDCLSLAPLVSMAESAVINRAFFYVFEHATKEGPYQYISSQGQRMGAVGGEELSYILGHPLVDQLTGSVLPFTPPPTPSSGNFTKAEWALSEQFMTFISNFAHTGDPNDAVKVDSFFWPVSKERNKNKGGGGGGPSSGPSVWEPFDRLHQKYLEITVNKLKLRTHYRSHQMAIWLRLVPELQRSGALLSSSIHNRMKGGNDPSLYVGRLRQPLDSSGDDDMLSAQNANAVSDMLGYHKPHDFGDDDGDGFNKQGPPPSAPTTCSSPLSSSSSPTTKERDGKSMKFNNQSSSSVLMDTIFAPYYSTALTFTIAVGCTLLILNVFVFALVYYHRDKKRTERIKFSSTHSAQKYTEPPELLKSTSTTTHCQTNPKDPEEGGGGESNAQSPTTAEQQLPGFGSPAGSHHSYNTYHHPYHLSQHQRGVVLSPTQASHQYHTMGRNNSSNPSPLTTATLPRGMQTMSLKPAPPERSLYSTMMRPSSLQGQGHQQSSQGMMMTSGDNNSMRFAPHFDDLNV